MLVLSRKTNESLVIEFGGEVVEVMVVSQKGPKVRLGVTAAREVRVNRKEVYLAIQRDGEAKRASEEPSDGDGDSQA